MTTSARYCPRCAGRLAGPPPTSCPACGYALYVNAKPSAGVVIVSGDRFLAVERAREPQAGQWELPGGFCDGWEHPADAAVREAREELGVDVRLDHLVGMYLGSYDFQGETLPVLECYWQATIIAGEIVLDPAEARRYTWLDLRKPPPLAFVTMDAAIADLTLGDNLLRLSR